MLPTPDLVFGAVFVFTDDELLDFDDFDVMLPELLELLELLELPLRMIFPVLPLLDDVELELESFLKMLPIELLLLLSLDVEDELVELRFVIEPVLLTVIGGIAFLSCSVAGRYSVFGLYVSFVE